MNEICDQCEHQEQTHHGGKVQCGKATYRSDDYGNFKQGCVCVYDKGLSIKFSPRQNDSPNVRGMSRIIESQRDQIMELDHKNSVLKQRILRIDE